MASLSRWASRIFEDVGRALPRLVSGLGEASRDDSAVFMLHLLGAGKWLKLPGHKLAQGRQRSPPILVRESLPKLVQIQCRREIRRSRRRPPFCNPCMAVLLGRR